MLEKLRIDSTLYKHVIVTVCVLVRAISPDYVVCLQRLDRDLGG